MLLINLFGGSYRGSIDNRRNIFYLNELAHRDTIVWDFYNGISESGLRSCLGKAKKAGKDAPLTFELSAGISGCDVHMWQWDQETEDLHYKQITGYEVDRDGAYLELKVVIMAHGNYDCPSFENDAGAQVHASVLIDAVLRSLYVPFPQGLGLTHPLLGMKISIQTCNSWLGDHSIKNAILAHLCSRPVGDFMKMVLPETQRVVVTGVERVSYSLGHLGYPERSREYHEAFLSLLQSLATSLNLPLAVLLRGGELSKQGKDYKRNDTVVMARSAVIALLEGELDKDSADKAQLDLQVKQRQLLAKHGIHYQSKRFDSNESRVTKKGEGTKHRLVITFGSKEVWATDWGKYDFSMKESRNIPYSTGDDFTTKAFDALIRSVSGHLQPMATSMGKSPKESWQRDWDGAVSRSGSRWATLLRDLSSCYPPSTDGVLSVIDVLILMASTTGYDGYYQNAATDQGFWAAWQAFIADHPNYRYSLSPVDVLRKERGHSPTKLTIMASDEEWALYESFKKAFPDFRYSH